MCGPLNAFERQLQATHSRHIRIVEPEIFAPQARDAIDNMHELFLPHRLQEVSDGVGLEGLQGMGNLRRQASQHFETCHPWHFDVEKDNIGLQFDDPFGAARPFSASPSTVT